ncbi:hypothetical protein BB561_002182 [Smittium simulii]|uniref:Splicing factor Cactin n=1 Tax=Smittium simulii TaxID=133385 RepID=A0A2T9YRD7_9FUNG|nr:hypothetical protein BB561_002182 [Smittium simulii]
MRSSAEKRHQEDEYKDRYNKKDLYKEKSKYASSDIYSSDDSDYNRKKHKKKSSRHSSKYKKSKRKESSSPDNRKSSSKKDSDSKNKEESYKYISNPYGEETLKKKFVWKKKEKEEKDKGYNKKYIEQRKLELRKESEIELQKLQERRKQREYEQLLKEKEMARLQQEAENEQLGDWQERENIFHLEQAKKRAEIRIKQDRAKPIDIFAINLKVATSPESDQDDLDCSYSLQFYEPWKIVDNLDLDDINELYSDIQMYLALEKQQDNLKFWESMIIVCDARKQRLQHALNSTGVSKDVEDEIINMLDNKTIPELIDLQNQIRKKVNSNEPVDMDYWEEVLKQIIVEQAKLKINEYHKKVMSALIKKTRQSQQIEAKRNQQELAAILSKYKTPSSSLDNTQASHPQSKILNYSSDLATPDFNSAQNNTNIEVFNQSMEPVLSEKILYEDRKLPLLTEEEDRENLVSKQILALEKSEEQNDEEQAFSTEALLESQTYSWEDKYKPRKPKYFNKVHTGYEWNKYNQTHYDFDNPPPRVVQGYKFNIFYPDLIDKSQTPTYKIEPDMEFLDPNDPEKKIFAFGKKTFKGETVIIRFIAGPPYEDLAFRIVNREWEYSRKYGFRNSFNGSVLQLHFRFRRQFYKR